MGRGGILESSKCNIVGGMVPTEYKVLSTRVSEKTAAQDLSSDGGFSAKS